MNNDLHMRDYSGNDLENPKQHVPKREDAAKKDAEMDALEPPPSSPCEVPAEDVQQMRPTPEPVSVDLASIPAYEGAAYVDVNGNVP